MDLRRIREIKRPARPVEPTVLITVRQVFDRGWWDDVCRMTGINEWAVNEGRMSYDDTIELTESQYRKLIDG